MDRAGRDLTLDPAGKVLQTFEVEHSDHAVPNAQQAGFLELVQSAVGV